MQRSDGVRLPLVIRSLGIILVSPLLTVPTSVVVGGSPEALASSPPEDVQRPSEAVYEVAARRPQTPSEPPAAPPAPRPVEVSVQCGQGGCVVVSGLEVTIVESVH